MAALAAILPEVSRNSSLVLELYQLAASTQDKAAEKLISLAKSVNSFSAVLKQVGAIIKEDDRLPSYEGIGTLEDVIEQTRSICNRIEMIISIRNTENDDNSRDSSYSAEPPTSMAMLDYLQAYTNALKVTLSVLLQSLQTAQSLMWSQAQSIVLPQQTMNAITSERIQLETAVIEQQLSILSTSQKCNDIAQTHTRLLMEADSSQSLVTTRHRDIANPAGLYQYQNKLMTSLDTSASTETEWLPAVCSIATSHSEWLLERWTSLPQFDDRLRNAEHEARAQKRETQQPMVESDSDDDNHQRQKLAGNGTRIRAHPQTTGSVQPLFTEANAEPNPERGPKYGPTAPLSPAASPSTSRHSSTASTIDFDLSASPRSSISSLPMEAAAAVEAKEEDNVVDLEIPWKLCTRMYYWKYVDSKIVGSNTDQLPSIAYLERNSWTEIMASWVCKEAIREAGYGYTQVQKDVRDGRRTKFETCFCIALPLQFQQVQSLVERTVDIYRQKQAAAQPPPPRARRSSSNRPTEPLSRVARAGVIDRDRTPVPKKPNQPPLERSMSSMPIPSQMPPSLDRSISMPGAQAISGSQHYPGPDPRTSNLHISMPPGPHINTMPQSPYAPPMAQSPYTPQFYNFPQSMYPPNAIVNNPPHIQSQSNAIPQSPLRQSRPHPKTKSRHDDEYTTTDSDNDRERRRHRSKSRSRYSGDRKRRSHTSKAMGALMGVGGLTALLDGLSGL